MAKIVEPDNTNKGELARFIAEAIRMRPELATEYDKALLQVIIGLGQAVQKELETVKARLDKLETYVNNLQDNAAKLKAEWKEQDAPPIVLNVNPKSHTYQDGEE